MKIKVGAAALLCCLALAAAAGCGGQGGRNSGEMPKDRIELVIYISSLSSQTAGDVKAAEELEKKFWKDTGTAVKLTHKLYSTDDLNTKLNLAITAKEQVDAVILHYGDDTGLNPYIRNNIAMELDELIAAYGGNLTKNIPAETWNTYRMNGNIYAVPGYEASSCYGILMRKDWREAASLPFPETIGQFTAVLNAYKAKASGMVPIVGNPWDMERCLTGAFKTYPYFSYVLDDSNTLTLGSMHKNRGAFMKQLYDWTSAKLWDSDNQNRKVDSAQNLMVTEKAGAYAYSPYGENLIRVSRMVKIENPAAQFEVITSLKGPDGGTSGMYEIMPSLTGLMIPKASTNAATMIKYLNWMYSSADNYDLARYGIEGEHWVKDGADKYGFPSGKETLFMTTPPVSGTLNLIGNKNVSDRILNLYTAEEAGWMKQIRENTVFKDNLSGYLLPSIVDVNASNAFSLAAANLQMEVVAGAWAGIMDPLSPVGGKTRQQHYTDLIYTNAAQYLSLLTTAYNLATA